MRRLISRTKAKIKVIAKYPTHADVRVRTEGCRGALLVAATSWAKAGAVLSNTIVAATNTQEIRLLMV